MTDTFDTASPPSPTGPAPRRRTRSAGHIAAIVISGLLLVPGLGMLAGSGAIALSQAVATDDDGYYRHTLDRIESDGVAIAAPDLWLDDVDDDAVPWVLDWLDLDLRLRVDGAASTDEVFVGIARAADVERYLAGAAYSEVIELDQRTPIYRQRAGSDALAAPLTQDFWAASASGPGEQELIWNARGGEWAAVVMNADGSPSVAADVELGARSGVATPVAIVLLVLGGTVTAIAVLLLVGGIRGRRLPPTPVAIDRPSPEPPAETGATARPDGEPAEATTVR